MSTSKKIMDLRIVAKREWQKSALLRLQSDVEPLPDITPGQFVQVRIDNSPTTYLRRPISVHNVDVEKNELWLLVQKVGKGTKALADLPVRSFVNLVLPLGNGFSLPTSAVSQHYLLVGGGIGVAPLLYYGKMLAERGHQVSFLLGGRSESDMIQLNDFEQYGKVYVCTEDGSLGTKGFVTAHTLLDEPNWQQMAVCGPPAMMKALASYARSNDIPCEVSLENTMACGLGACLCCVENTTEGHVCVCKEGPVFDINKLQW